MCVIALLSRWWLFCQPVCTFPELVADDTPECDIAADWVSARKGALPSELDRLTAFPVVYQRTIFASLSTGQKISILRERLARAASDAELDANQRAVIVGVSKQLDEIVGQRKDDARMSAIQNSIDAAFPPDSAASAKAREIFYSLGGAPEGALRLRRRQSFCALL